MAGQEEVVIDASIAVKWFSAEEGMERAFRIRDDYIAEKMSLMAPDLIIYELANALRYKPGFDSEDVAKAVGNLLDLQIDLITPSKELVRRSSELAFKHIITLYDSCYLALGELMGIKVLTSDKQFYDRARNCGFLRFL